MPNPSKTLVDVCEKVLLILNQPDKSFQSFKVLAKDFGILKDLMSAVQGQTLSDNVINEILPIWKNQTMIQAKLLKTSKCACLLAQWIAYIVEYSLKKETVNSSKKREPELEKKIKNQVSLISELSLEISKIEEKIAKIKKLIECKIELENEEISENKRIVPEGGNDTHFINKIPVSGIIGHSYHSRAQSFPNFNDKELYKDAPVQENEENFVTFEGKNEIGCCRMKFLCF